MAGSRNLPETLLELKWVDNPTYKVQVALWAVPDLDAVDDQYIICKRVTPILGKCAKPENEFAEQMAFYDRFVGGARKAVDVTLRDFKFSFEDGNECLSPIQANADVAAAKIREIVAELKKYRYHEPEATISTAPESTAAKPTQGDDITRAVS